MSELTREQAIREAVARGWCDPANSHKEMDSILAESIVREVLALALTARSEGFREGVEAAAKECMLAPSREEDHDAQRARDRTRRNLAAAIRALSPRETDAETLRKAIESAPPGDFARAAPAAPSSEVAEMVKRLRECLSEHNRIRIAFLHNLERSVKPLEYETERQAFEALNNAAALLSKVGQGWVPVSVLPNDAALCYAKSIFTFDDNKKMWRFDLPSLPGN